MNRRGRHVECFSIAHLALSCYATAGDGGQIRRRPRGAFSSRARRARRNGARRRLDDRLGDLHRLRADDARARVRGMAPRGVGVRRNDDGRRRGAVRQSGRALSARRRPVRVSARGVRPVRRLSLRLDALPRHPDGNDRRSRRRLRALHGGPRTGARRRDARRRTLGRARDRDSARRTPDRGELPRRRGRKDDPERLHAGEDRRPRRRRRALRRPRSAARWWARSSPPTHGTT